MSNELATITVTPMELIARAQASNASIEQMTMFFELQLRYEANEACKAYNQAMSVFRSECPEIPKTKKGHNGKYSGLAETIQIINPVLAMNGLSHQWKTEQVESGVKVICIVTHVLGHCEQTSLSAAGDKSGGKTDIHALASTISYLERYTLFALLGLAGQEMDDDGNSASKKTTEAIITETQAGDLLALIDEVKSDVAKFCTYYHIDSVAQLPLSKFNQAVKGLESKRGK